MSGAHPLVRPYLAGVALVFGLAACTGGQDPQAFCDQLASIAEEMTAAPAVDDDPAGFRASAGRLGPLLTEARDSAPDDSAADYELVSTQMLTFIATVETAGDDHLEALWADFHTPDEEFDAALDNLDGYAQTECGLDLA